MANVKNEKTCFVIMPFSDDMAEVYWKAIQPACDKAGFSALRVDQLEGVYNINQKIIENIFSSEAIIADLTDWRPNVFYEMGVAHAIDNKTIMIIQKKDKVPFDVHSYRCIEYEQTEAGLIKLSNSLINSLKSFDAWRQHPTNPVQQFKPHDAFIPKRALDETRHDLEQKKAELESLQKEIERLRLLTATPVAAPLSSQKRALQLRFQTSTKLSGDEVIRMLREKGFFDSSRHVEGKGAPHQYEQVERQEQKLVFDHATGLIWQRSGSEGVLTYTGAVKYVQELNQQHFAGFQNWRLPTLEEAMSLVEPKRHGELYLEVIFDHRQRWVWTVDKFDDNAGWIVSFEHGSCGHGLRGLTESTNFVRALQSM